jgi:hypothetical protein
MEKNHDADCDCQAELLVYQVAGGHPVDAGEKVGLTGGCMSSSLITSVRHKPGRCWAIMTTRWLVSVTVMRSRARITVS